MKAEQFAVFRVLKQRQIALLWVGQLCSAFGDRFFEIAVTWLSVQIVGSEAGFVLAAGSISRLITGLLGGVYADRWDRQKTMVVVDLLRALAILTLPVAAYISSITLLHLAIVSAITSGLSGVFDPTIQASLPVLAPDTRSLQASNALLDVTSRMARIFAPSLAGLLAGFLPLQHFFTIDAATFVVSAVGLFLIGRNFAWQPTVTPNSGGPRAIIADIHGAITLVRQNRAVFWSLLSYVAANITWSIVMVVGLALFADEVLGRDVQGYSFLITAYGLGSVLSNIVIGGLTVKNRPRFLFIGLTIFGFGLLLTALTNSYYLALGTLFFTSLGTPMSDLTILLMIQGEFPSNQIGKIFSLRLTISSLGYSLGLLLAAPLFQLVSISAGMALGACLSIAVGIAGLARFWRSAD